MRRCQGNGAAAAKVRPWRAALAVPIVGFAMLGSTSPVAPDSADARFIPGLNKVRADLGEVFRKGCMVGDAGVRSGACRFGDRRSSKKVVLFGDSHAMQWGPGVIRLAKHKGWQVIALTKSSCPPAQVHRNRNCDTWRRNSLKRIRRMRPGLVVVSTAANVEAYSVTVNGLKLSRAASEPYLVDGMKRVLKKLRRWSRRTVVLRDQAVTPFGVTRCLRSNQSKPSNCGFRPYRPLNQSYDYKATRSVKNVRLVDPQRILCQRRWCRAVDRNYLIYRNHGHLSASYTRFKYRWLGRKLGDPWRGRSAPPPGDG